MDYKKIWTEFQLDNELSKIISNLKKYPEKLGDLPELKRYLTSFLNLPGKRKRLIKMIAFSNLCGGMDKNSRHIINALEYANAAIFIDDDIIDHDQFRKGRPTLNKLIGYEKTLLIGNMLFALSIRELLNLECDSKIKNEIIKDFLKSLFIENTGQYMDLSFRKNFKNKKLKDWEKMVYRHSGAYVISALKAIARINNNPQYLSIIEDYELNCTYAGAAEDALLGFYGNKKPPRDLKEKGFTILVSFAKNDLEIDLNRLKENIEKSGAIAKTKEYILKKISLGKKALESLETSFEKEVLTFLLEELKEDLN